MCSLVLEDAPHSPYVETNVTAHPERGFGLVNGSVSVDALDRWIGAGTSAIPVSARLEARPAHHTSYRGAVGAGA